MSQSSKMMYFPPEPFTMAEFMKVNQLGSPHDVPAVQIVSNYLRRSGYERVRRRRKADVEVCWRKGNRLEELKEKLK